MTGKRFKFAGTKQRTMNTVPARIQRSRKAGSTTPANTKYCGRLGKWGNPFVVNKHDANYYRVAVNMPENEWGKLKRAAKDIYITGGAAGFKTKREAQAHAAFLFGCLMNEFPVRYDVQELAQYAHLSCWCALDAPCHVDEIIKRINHLLDAGNMGKTKKQ